MLTSRPLHTHRVVRFEEHASNTHRSRYNHSGLQPPFVQQPVASHRRTTTNPKRGQRAERLKALAKLTLKPFPKVVSALAHNQVPSGPRRSTGQKTLQKMVAYNSTSKKQVVRQAARNHRSKQHTSHRTLYYH